MGLNRIFPSLNAKFLFLPAIAHIFRLLFAWHLKRPTYFTSQRDNTAACLVFCNQLLGQAFAEIKYEGKGK